MMSKLKISVNTLFIILLLSMISLSVVVKMTRSDSYFGYHLRVILSDSMAPKMPSGSLLIAKEVEMPTIQLNDVIVAKIDTIVVTHRVIGIEEKAGEILLRTKGDNNQVPDSFQVKATDCQEKALIAIPYLGKFLLKLQTKRGIIAAIALIVVVYLVDYLLKILNSERNDLCEE